MLTSAAYIGCDDDDCDEIIGLEDVETQHNRKSIIALAKKENWLIVNKQYFCPAHHGSYHRTRRNLALRGKQTEKGEGDPQTGSASPGGRDYQEGDGA